jgi:hypothetical protein
MTLVPLYAWLTSSGNRCCWRRFGVVIGVLLLWEQPWATVMTYAQPVVEGVGVIVQNNQAAARARAIQEAMRKAIEQVVTELVEPRLLVTYRQTLEAQVYARAERFIRSYRVLWEYPDVPQKVYRVGIEVEVASRDITHTIGMLGGGAGETPAVAPDSGEKGWILVRFVENQLEQTGLGTFGRVSGIVAAGLRMQLQAQGWRLITPEPATPWDGQESSALMAARAAGAGVVLVGRADVQRLRSDVAGVASQAVEASVQVQAFAVQSGERLALERIQTTALHPDPAMASKQALEKAVITLVTRLTPVLRAYQQQLQELPGPSAIRAR